MKRLILVRLLGGAIPVAVLLGGCGGTKETSEPIDTSEQPVINGTLVSDAANPGVVAVYHQFIRPCTGALLALQWVLTARHCLTTDGKKDGPLILPSQVTVVRASSPGLTPPPTGGSIGQSFVADSGRDYALVRIWPPLNAALPLWNGNTSAHFNQTMRAMGFGRFVLGDDTIENGTSGAGTLRMADLVVSGTDAETFEMRTNPSGQNIWHGDSGGPAFRLTDRFGRSMYTVAGVSQLTTTTASIATHGSVDFVRAWIKRGMLVPGDTDRNGAADIVLTGGVGWSTIPVAFFSPVSHAFGVTNTGVADFPAFAALPDARPLSGDFNGDGRRDVALVGSSAFGSIPIAFSVGNGSFNVTNTVLADFPGWASLPGVKHLAGDFNGDGMTDIALTGRSGWTGIPVAFSQANGSFSVSTRGVSSFPGWAATAGAKAIAGDFDGDGRDDIALTGGATWNTIPIAFSNGDGSFLVKNHVVTNFPGWAATAGAKAVGGDFNGDGRDDVLITGPGLLGSIAIAFSRGDSAFDVVASIVPSLPGWAAEGGAKVLSGDLNRDRKDDLIVTGVSGWTTIKIGLGDGIGNFAPEELVPGSGSFASWAAAAGAKPLSGKQGQ